MRRWLTPVCVALAGLILTASILPFRDQTLELQADGKNLGRIPALVYRILAVALGSLPLWILAAAVGISRRLRASIHDANKPVATAFVLGALLMIWIYREIRI
jgi:hypothetical protein